MTSSSRGAASKPLAIKPIIGAHPKPPDPFGVTVDAKDGTTINKVPHRQLTEQEDQRVVLVGHLRALLAKHHISPEAMQRSADLREAMQRLGLNTQQTQLGRYPASVSTQKGNLAEIVLAEYVVATGGVVLPIYRLRYNPNVNQSMKGDDVLAFDLDEKPVRIIVGEAKFRASSSTAAVTKIVAELLRSHLGGIPVSLQFVADRLFESGQADLGSRVMDCARLFALGELRLDYVGLLLSDTQAGARVHTATPSSLRRLAMISLGVQDPNSLVEACYKDLE